MRAQSLWESGASSGRGEEEVRPELVQELYNTDISPVSGGVVLSPIQPKYTYLTKYIQKPPADKNTMLDYLSRRSDDEMSIMKSCDFFINLDNNVSINWIKMLLIIIFKPESVEELISCQFQID